MELGIISGKDVFVVDHTKYQANRDPYKMISKKSLAKRLICEGIATENDFVVS